MAETVEVLGPSGPLILELSDAALSTMGRDGAITAALAAATPPTPKRARDAQERDS
jgi:hypothetical protein